MRRRLLRMIVLLWIGWYLSGPAAETFDYWDGPHAEAHDILFNAGGGVTLVACAFSLVVLQAKKLREMCSLPDVGGRAPAVAASRISLPVHLLPLPASNHSPPTPLRI